MTRNKIMCLVIGVLFSALGLSNPVSDDAEMRTCVLNGISWQYVPFADGAMIVSSSVGHGMLDIPSQVDGLQVLAIGKDAFKDKGAITEVRIPPAVEIIYNGAFAACVGVTEIELPSSVTNLGEWVADTNICEVVTNIYMATDQAGYMMIMVTNIKSKVCTSWGSGVFEGCSSITSIIMNEGLLSVGAKAFKQCTNLRKVVMPDSVTMIGAGAFSGCKRLESVSLPKNLEILGFAYGLVESGGFTGLGRFVFEEEKEEFTTLDGTTLPSITTITRKSMAKWDETSYFCRTNLHATYMKSYTDPAGYIRDVCCPDIRWFEANTNSILYTLQWDGGDLGDSVADLREAEIEEYGLSISLSEDDEQILADQRMYYYPREPVYSSVTDGVFYSCIKLKKIDLPEKLRRIADYAFYDCCRLTKIRLPTNLQLLGYQVFGGESSLYDVETPWFQHGSLREIFPTYSLITNLVISDSVRDLRVRSFAEWRDEVSSRFSPSNESLSNQDRKTLALEYLEEYKRFWKDGVLVSTDGCVLDGFVSLQNLVLPETLIEFDDFLGLSCAERITDFHVHKKMERIGSNSFFGTKIRNVEFYGTLKELRSHVFAGSSITNMMFYGNAPEIVSADIFTGEDVFDFDSYASEDLIVRVLQGSTGWSLYGGVLPEDGFWPETASLYKCREIAFCNQRLDDIAVYKYFDESSDIIRELPVEWLLKYDLLYQNKDGDVLLSELIPLRTRSLYQSYVGGLDPTNELSVLAAKIEIIDDMPKITWTPQLPDEEAIKRKYTIYGKVTLDDEEWQVVDDTSGYKFFKVGVEMR